MRRPENADVGILGIQLQGRDGAVQRSCARFPTPLSIAGAMCGIDRALPALVPPHFMREWDHVETREVDQVIGAFFMVRRSLFEALGGFDERFFVYYEDLDFSLRARRAGWRSVYYTGARAKHAGGASSSRIPVLRRFYVLRSRALYCRKHFGAAQAAGVLAMALVVEPFARAVHALATGPAEARHVFPAWWKFVDWLRRPAANEPATQPSPGDSILVYTSGKGGTNAFRRGLREAGMTVYKAHALNPEFLEKSIARETKQNHVRRVHHEALAFVREVLPGMQTVPTVTLVREAIGRNMSGFFQTLWRQGIAAPYESVDVDRLIELFFSKYNHERADRWFENDFRASIGIDPFTAGFDPEQGWLRLQSGKFDLLLMQLELGNENLSRLISGFTGRNVDIQQRHRSSDKDYGALYEEFKKRIAFPDDYLDRVLDTRVMRTFYSEQQRSHIRAWYRRETPALAPLPRAGRSN